MIQFMPVNYSRTNRGITVLIHSAETHFQEIFITLLFPVAKDMMSSLISKHDFKAANFDPVKMCIKNI